MIVYQIDPILSDDFAHCIRVFVEYENWPENRCSSCNLSVRVPKPYLVVRWEPGTDVVGDFTFSMSLPICRREIGEELCSKFGGLELGEVRFAEFPKAFRPTNPRSRRKKQVWLPYEGPPLCILRAVRKVSLLPQSTVKVERSCAVCGSLLYAEINGLESYLHQPTINPYTKEPQPQLKHIVRGPGEGLFFSHKSLNGDDIFSPKFTGHTLCTERVKEYIEQRGWNNVRLLEAGELVDD